jgi:hypothetical protein
MFDGLLKGSLRNAITTLQTFARCTEVRVSNKQNEVIELAQPSAARLKEATCEK